MRNRFVMFRISDDKAASFVSALRESAYVLEESIGKRANELEAKSLVIRLPEGVLVSQVEE